MSRKDLVKQSMLKELELKQAISLKEKLGKENSLYACQEIIAAKQLMKTNIVGQGFALNELSVFARKQKRDLKVQKEALKELEKLKIDDIIDDAAEIKSALEDIKAIVTEEVTDL